MYRVLEKKNLSGIKHKISPIIVFLSEDSETNPLGNRGRDKETAATRSLVTLKGRHEEWKTDRKNKIRQIMKEDGDKWGAMNVATRWCSHAATLTGLR